jgi:hypothetical protein
MVGAAILRQPNVTSENENVRPDTVDGVLVGELHLVVVSGHRLWEWKRIAPRTLDLTSQERPDGGLVGRSLRAV